MCFCDSAFSTYFEDHASRQRRRAMLLDVQIGQMMIDLSSSSKLVPICAHSPPPELRGPSTKRLYLLVCRQACSDLVNVQANGGLY
ncbi:unnamed protein product [Protopolystoma xenopodis]|uniref:Uncharacterized protein n=1 Tax=Protopolystoma xenopodis TaxID=117903 RepID=A0A3S5CCM6_9PLAT|nr:unnamed protein product [Protopolystoma xenopodis]